MTKVDDGEGLEYRKLKDRVKSVVRAPSKDLSPGEKALRDYMKHKGESVESRSQSREEKRGVKPPSKERKGTSRVPPMSIISFE